MRYEGQVRSNIANTLSKLNRYDDARTEIQRTIECFETFGLNAEPWRALSVLQNIEEATGNPAAARAAWMQARDAYLAYRQQGGYAQSLSGQLVDQSLGLIQQGKASEIQPLFNQYSNASESFKKFMQIVVDILSGSRDVELGDDPAFDYKDAAEVLFLIERLG